MKPTVAFFTLLESEVINWVLDYAPAGWAIHTHSLSIPDNEKINILNYSDFLLLFPEEISNRVLSTAPHLKLIQLLSAGYDLVDINKCVELGIPVANNGGTNAIDVAEYAITLILSFYRHIIEQDRLGRVGNWDFQIPNANYYTINGKVTGIIGLGKIGKQVAHLLSAFGAQVIYYDAIRLLAEEEQALNATYHELHDLIRLSDVITLHVPLTPTTRHMIGAKEFSLMKPNALLVNTCRGEVVDESVLIKILQERKILGAALDVLTKEPPEIDHPLRTLDNVILTPHIAGRTRDTWSRRGEFVFNNMIRVWEGKAPLALISL